MDADARADDEGERLSDAEFYCGVRGSMRYRCTLPRGHEPAELHEAVGSDDQVLDRWSDR